MDLEESDDEAYNQWLEQWLREAREARAALGPPPAGAVEPAVPPARMHVADDSIAAGPPPTLASETVLAPPPEALYWKVLEGQVHHVGQIVQSESVGDGDDGDVTLRMLCKGSGRGVMVPTQLLVFKRSAVESSNLEAFIAWKKETEESDSDHAAPASAAHDTDDVGLNEDRNDSAQAAFGKP